MSRPLPFLRLCIVFAVAAHALPARAYNFSGPRWNSSTVVMQLQLGSSGGTLIDGNTAWGPVAEDALATWNNVLTNVKYTVVRDSTATKTDGNRLNNVFFSSTIYGEAWDSRTLAITLSSYNPATNFFTETDVLFNSTLGWNSYRGNLRIASGNTYLNDFRRVAIHEFGHALGLDHPDQAIPAQSVTAVMNANVSNTDTVAADDIAGARALYDGTTLTAPAITTQPTSRTAAVGSSTTFTVVATGTAPLGYVWSKNNVAIPNATSASLTLSSVAASDAGNYTVTITNSAGSVTSSTAVLTVNTAAVAPTISTQPVSQSVTAGASVSFSVTAAGTAPLTYQWKKAGANISGATSATYTIASTATADAGSYTVTITNSAGTITSTAATLTVTAAPTGPASRLSNLSVLTTLAARQSVTVGFTMSGGSKQILARAVGPGLASLGVGGTLPDPELTLYDSTSTEIAYRDDYRNTIDTAATAAITAVGAFPLPNSSLDAAILRSISGGTSAKVAGSATAFSPATNAGVVIVEVYDAGTGNSPRLTNLSALNFVGTGGNILTAGFTLRGTGTKRVLIRAVGPGLTALGVGGVLLNPQLEVYAGQTKIATNDDWSSTLASTFASVGAFGLTVGSRDAALIIDLSASNSGTGYSVQVSGVNNTTGNAIIEVYELP